MQEAQQMDTYDRICMWCGKIALMREEEYNLFKSILLEESGSDREQDLILKTIEYVEKLRAP